MKLERGNCCISRRTWSRYHRWRERFDFFGGGVGDFSNVYCNIELLLRTALISLSFICSLFTTSEEKKENTIWVFIPPFICSPPPHSQSRFIGQQTPASRPPASVASWRSVLFPVCQNARVCHCGEETVAGHGHSRAAERFQYPRLLCSSPTTTPTTTLFLLPCWWVTCVSVQSPNSLLTTLPSVCSPSPQSLFQFFFFSPANLFSGPLLTSPPCHILLPLSLSSNREGTACCRKRPRLH